MSDPAVYIETFSGTCFRPLAPSIDDIQIEDIAHGLAYLCRFVGHTKHFYSVAEHSLRVSYLIEKLGGRPVTCLWGLMHDASEAYLGDLATPLKSHPGFGAAYRDAEARLMECIAQAFELPLPQPIEVEFADATLLATEARDLMPFTQRAWGKLEMTPLDDIIEPFSPEVAEAVFLRRFDELVMRRAA